VPEQVSDLFVTDDRRQVFDKVSAAIDQPAVGAVDFADRGLRGNHTFQPRAELGHDR
jgi:hypothetical protein